MLETRKLTKNFKGLCAVNNLDLNIDAGEIVGIIGPNGAEKTAVFNLITGFISPTKGKVIFDGRDITGQKPHMIAQCGIVRTFQLDRIFHDFTILQNIVASSYLYSRIGFWQAALATARYQIKYKDTLDHAMKIVQFVGLDDKKYEIARGTPEEAKANAEVIKAYLGTDKHAA